MSVAFSCMYVCMYVSASPSPEETTFEDWYAIECVRRTRRDPSNIKYEWTLYLHAEKKVKNWEELIQKSIRKFYLVFTLHDVESDQQSIHTSSFLDWWIFGEDLVLSSICCSKKSAYCLEVLPQQHFRVGKAKSQKDSPSEAQHHQCS